MWEIGGVSKVRRRADSRVQGGEEERRESDR